MSSSPDVSVVLSVRNGGTDLAAAVESILTQTFGNFELIAINNGSTDGTAAFLDGLTDSRVRVYHQADAGLAAALNRGIALARGRYIARQDHDDLALPTRIEKQVRFLDAHPDYALIGTRADIWVGDRATGRFLDHPVEDAAIRFELLFDSRFVHSSVMIRKAALATVGVYSTDPVRQPPEDYELWSRIARRYRVANLPELLTIYREVPGSMSRESAHPFREKLVLLSAENFAAATGLSQPAAIHFQLARLVHGVPDPVPTDTELGTMHVILEQAAGSIAEGPLTADLRRRLAAWKRTLDQRARPRKPRLRRIRAVARRVRDGLTWFRPSVRH